MELNYLDVVLYSSILKEYKYLPSVLNTYPKLYNYALIKKDEHSCTIVSLWTSPSLGSTRGNL